jgi:hypothetical protein
MPERKTLEAMGRYNEELARAGVLRGGGGLHPSSKGARVRFSGGKPTVVDGPFPETKELIAGFWIIEVKSRDEAIEWARRIPFDPDVHFGGEGEVELRQIFEAADFGDEFTPELREAEERLRRQL